ncbi:hypothetical protein [Mycolicibacterium porcinum]|uniref:hypothetical protein n=1 Tax=Mycolicibacterium porcinum TaxID=39693 RepID=UPI0008487815|nr:hypothetical protein [Mycolicibacterium porcinum]ODR17606.1 hypothetical protein BHQ19_28625 [Mycolicibacterium porcinum]
MPESLLDPNVRDLSILVMPNRYRTLMKITEVDGPEFKSEQASSDDAAGIGRPTALPELDMGKK